jgi:hypothetical protein
MSNENDNKKPDPPNMQANLQALWAEIRPFMQPHERPSTPSLGDDPKLDKAVAEFLAPLPDEPVEQDLSIGMGNAKQSAETAPVARVEGPRITATKIKINVDDVPRELPAGSPTATTDELDTRAFQAARAVARAAEDEDETTLAAAPKSQGTQATGRTIGGRTERIPIVERPAEEPAGASPWTA